MLPDPLELIREVVDIYHESLHGVDIESLFNASQSLQKALPRSTREIVPTNPQLPDIHTTLLFFALIKGGSLDIKRSGDVVISDLILFPALCAGVRAPVLRAQLPEDGLINVIR